MKWCFREQARVVLGSFMVAGSVALSVGGCGKVLHLSARDSNALQLKNQDVGLVVGSTGTVTPVSVFDAGNKPLVLPYSGSNSSTDFRNPGHAQVTGSVTNGTGPSGSVASNPGANLIFRAVSQVPPQNQIAKIKAIHLTLNGLRKTSFDQKSAGTLSGQVFCLWDGLICSGEIADRLAPSRAQNASFWSSAKMASAGFANLHLSKVLSKGADGTFISTTAAGENGATVDGELDLDLKDLMGLNSLSDSDQIQWVYDHSTPYADPGYRKFRFLVADGIYVEGGSIRFDFDLVSELDPTYGRGPGAPLNGPDDAKNAVDTDGGADSSVTTSTAISTDSGSATSTATVTATSTSTATSVGTSVVSSTATATDTALNPVLPSPPVPANPDDQTPINRPADVNVMLESEVLLFKTNVSAISAVSVLKTQQTARLFKKYLAKIEKIEVVGQTDLVGTREYNQKLSVARAKAVISVFERQGLPKELLLTTGVGQPKVSSCAPKKKCAKDRVVVIKVDLKPSLTPDQRAAYARRINLVLGIIWLNSLEFNSR